MESLPWLRAWIMRRRGIARLGAEDVMDIVQDVCTEALSAHTYSPRGKRAGRVWLKTIARRRLADRVRFWSTCKREVSRRVALVNAEDVLGPESRPLDVLARDELSARIADAIAGLPAAQRDVLTEQWYRGRSTREIARSHGRSENAVRILRSRGLAALRAAVVETRRADR